MAFICGFVNQNFVLNCGSKPIGGVKSRLYLINSADIASVTYDSTNPLIVTAMTLATGKQAWTWDVFKRNHKPKAEQKDNDYGSYYQHSLVSYIPEWDNATKIQVEQLANGYYVAIVENLQNNTDAAFEIYGLKSGIRSQDGAIRDLGANEGIMTLTLSNDADMFEDHLPASFAVAVSSVYSYTATKAAVVALVTPAT